MRWALQARWPWRCAPWPVWRKRCKTAAPEDLDPIAPQDLPADILPLVSAVNQHMARSQALIAQQRQFLDDASHQLRTHLTTLQMQIDCARREPDTAAVQSTLEALGAEISRATRSTQQLLALGRSDTAALDCTPMDLAALLRSVALELLPQARAKHIDFGIHPPSPSRNMAMADAHLMREALTNLAANAIAYTPAGGTVTLAAAGDDLGWSLSVEDDGPGLNEEERATLGQRFRRGHKPRRLVRGLGWPLRAPSRSGTRAHCGCRRASMARGCGCWYGGQHRLPNGA